MMDMEEIIKKNGGNVEAHRLVKALDSVSFAFRLIVMISVLTDVEVAAVDGDTINPFSVFKTAVRRYILENPEEYRPEFECCFRETELKTLFKGVA